MFLRGFFNVSVWFEQGLSNGWYLRIAYSEKENTRVGGPNFEWSYEWRVLGVVLRDTTFGLCVRFVRVPPGVALRLYSTHALYVILRSSFWRLRFVVRGREMCVEGQIFQPPFEGPTNPLHVI